MSDIASDDGKICGNAIDDGNMSGNASDDGKMSDTASDDGKTCGSAIDDGNMSGIASDDGRMPEVGTPKDGRILDGTAPPRNDRTSDGTASRDGRIPDGTAPPRNDRTSDGIASREGKIRDGTSCEGSAVGTETGTRGVCKRDSTPPTTSGKALGKASRGRPDASQECKSGKLGRSEDKAGRRSPEEEVGVGEAVGVGVVGLRLGGPKIPGSSDRTEDSFPDRSGKASTFSEVEIALDVEAEAEAIGVGSGE